MTGIDLVVIPRSSFVMGSHDGAGHDVADHDVADHDVADNERPLHRVVISAFEIGVCQVTNLEWSRFMEATGHPPPSRWSDPDFNHPQQPVVAVSWFDAISYCSWLSGVSSRHIRLPTEAEWECAARGGVEGARYPWGDEVLSDDGRWTSGPSPVALDPPNGYGLFDVCTNVHEWCSDWYGANYYAAASLTDALIDPRGPDKGTRRVSRGGSWRHQVKVTRCAARSSIPPEFRYADYGFRIACDVLLTMSSRA